MQETNRGAGRAGRMIGQAIVNPAPLLAGIDQPRGLEQAEVLRDGRRRQVEQGGDLAGAEFAAAKRQEGADAALIGQGVGDGEEFVHRTRFVISSINEIIAGEGGRGKDPWLRAAEFASSPKRCDCACGAPSE